MVGGQDRFSGNILLYDYLLSKRAPPFLNRNLTRALRIHQHMLGHGGSVSFPGPDHDLRKFWQEPTKFLSWDDLDDMIEREILNSEFVLRVHGITRLDSRAPERSESPRKQRMNLRLKSTIQARISPDRRQASKANQKAILTGFGSEYGKAVKIETEPIKIDANSVLNQIENLKATGDYQMVLSIDLGTQTESEELFAYLSPKSKHSRQGLPTILEAVWDNILKCPTGRTTLPLSAPDRNLNLGIEVSMWWNEVTGESILTSHNQTLRKKAQVEPFLNPNSGARNHNKYKLTFVYADETLQRMGLVCPHAPCHKRRSHDIYDLRMHLDSWHDYFSYRVVEEGVSEDGFERWRFESEVSDHHADQRASAKADEPYDVNQVAPNFPFDQRKYLDHGIDDFQKSSRTSRQRIKIIKPKPVPVSTTRRPSPLRRRLPDQVQPRHTGQKPKFPVPEAPEGVTFVRSCTRRPLKTGECVSESDDELDETWVDVRKAAEYDGSEHMSSDSKQFLTMFDSFMRREHLVSDFHAGDSLVRFTREKALEIWETDLAGPFNTKLNEWLNDDIISAEVHAGCIDILDSNKPAEDALDPAKEMSQRLATLDVASADNWDLYEDSTKAQDTTTTATLRQVVSEDDMQREIRQSRRRKSDKAKGKAIVTETGHLTPITADSDGDVEMREALLSTETDMSASKEKARQSDSLPYDLCLCGHDAQVSPQPSQLVACNNMDCIRRQFHYACLKQHWSTPLSLFDLRKRSWVCKDCSNITQ